MNEIKIQCPLCYATNIVENKKQGGICVCVSCHESFEYGYDSKKKPNDVLVADFIQEHGISEDFQPDFYFELIKFEKLSQVWDSADIDWHNYLKILEHIKYEKQTSGKRKLHLFIYEVLSQIKNSSDKTEKAFLDSEFSLLTAYKNYSCAKIKKQGFVDILSKQRETESIVYYAATKAISPQEDVFSVADYCCKYVENKMASIRFSVGYEEFYKKYKYSDLSDLLKKIIPNPFI